jgi:transcriptional repressor NrdR
VIDSRATEEGAAIRRRRQCNVCGRRYTTFERIDAPLMVLKRSGVREPFDRAKVVRGLEAATKNRPVADTELETVAMEVEEWLREQGTEVTSQQVGVAVLERLADLDDVAYLRFASVYKGFEGAHDFEREAFLLTKTTAPKRRDG